MALKEKASKMPPMEDREGGVPVKKKHKKRVESYERYIFKVLKQIHPKMRISKQAMGIMTSCVTDTFERISGEAGKLCRLSKKDTMGVREIQSAVRLVFPGELSKHAISEGQKACHAYKAVTAAE
eukprot:TRINITY_DN1287_c0_g1_i1.p2 TRINITY_DN1287_c0_g1~~TRINITY_DN1287_c0_g1_i1.p2  ORF type:complete len:125 (+),score=41.10 TRINITY_DN1287_c0_g1_i1:83-457(+)